MTLQDKCDTIFRIYTKLVTIQGMSGDEAVADIHQNLGLDTETIGIAILKSLKTL